MTQPDIWPEWDESLVAKARANKREGMERVERNTDKQWAAYAYQAVVVISKYRPEFTADPVWALLAQWEVPPPHEPRALGPVMLKAVRSGVCVKTDRTRRSVLPQRNMRPIAIYRSKIYDGPHALPATS